MFKSRPRKLDEYIHMLSTNTRSGLLDVDSLIRKLVEEAVREALISANGCKTCREELTPVLNILKSLDERLSRIEEGITKVMDACNKITTMVEKNYVMRHASIVDASVQKPHGQGVIDNTPSWLQQLESRLAEKGYVLSREIPGDVLDNIDSGLLSKRGYVLVPLGRGELIIVSRTTLGELRKLLSRLKEGDEYEVEAKLGRYALLFRALRRGGYIYYAGPSRGWALVLNEE